MRVLSSVLTTITLCFGFTCGAWAGSELVTPLLLTFVSGSSFQCIVTNATATKTLAVSVTLFDENGTSVQDFDFLITPRATATLKHFPDLAGGRAGRSCVVDVLGGQDASLVRAILARTDSSLNILNVVEAR